MSYQGVVNIIRGVAEAVNPDGFFQHGRTWDASLNFDEGNPQIYLYPLQNSIDESNHYYETWSVVMGFFIQDTQDSSPTQREEIIKNADILQRQFTTALNQIEGIEVSAIRTEPKYRQMAGTYSGVLLNFTLGATTNICGDEAEVVIIEPETLCDKIDTCLNIDRENGNEASFLTNKGTFAEPDTETNWGEITGTLSNQTDLQTALNGKSNTVHHHDERYYTETEVDAALSVKANITHAHNISDVTGLSSALNAKEDSANKATSMSGNTANNTVYLSAKAVYDWAVATFQTIITAASWGTFISSLSAKAIPADADTFAISDSAAANVAKKLTWANLKAEMYLYVLTQLNLVTRTFHFDDLINGVPVQTQGSPITYDTAYYRLLKPSASALNRPTVTGRPGIIQWNSTNNSLSQGHYIYSTANISVDANLNSATNVWCINTNDLSGSLGASDKFYTLRVGFIGAVGNSNVDGAGCYFRYTHNVNSGKWQCVNNNGSLETALDSGVAPAANTWVVLKVVVSQTDAMFYINGVLVQTITTNMPSVLIYMGVYFVVHTNSSFVAKAVSVDYYSYDIILNNNR